VRAPRRDAINNPDNKSSATPPRGGLFLGTPSGGRAKRHPREPVPPCAAPRRGARHNPGNKSSATPPRGGLFLGTPSGGRAKRHPREPAPPCAAPRRGARHNPGNKSSATPPRGGLFLGTRSGGVAALDHRLRPLFPPGTFPLIHSGLPRTQKLRCSGPLPPLKQSFPERHP
jgi:hypothetical protein